MMKNNTSQFMIIKWHKHKLTKYTKTQANFGTQEKHKEETENTKNST